MRGKIVSMAENVTTNDIIRETGVCRMTIANLIRRGHIEALNKTGVRRKELLFDAEIIPVMRQAVTLSERFGMGLPTALRMVREADREITRALVA